MDRIAFRKSIARQLALGPGIVCPVCLKEANDGDDLHHTLVKRSAVIPDKQELINVQQNLLFCHHQCHMEQGQSISTTINGLRLLCLAQTPTRVGEWYTSLWEKHEIPLPRGMLMPKKALPTWTSLQYFELGRELMAPDVPDKDSPGWTINPGEPDASNFLAMCGRYWWQKIKTKKMRPPNEYNGIHRARVVDLMNDGYWLEYLAGVFGTSIEELTHVED